MNAKTLTLITGHFTRTIGMSQNSYSRAICWVHDDSKSVARNSAGVGAVYTESFENVDTEPMDTAMRPGSVCDDGSMGIYFCPAKHCLKPS